MTTFRADPALPLPPTPGAVSVLDATEAALAQPGPATGRPFLLEVGGVRVTGTERGGVESVRIADRPVLAGLTSSGGPAANVVATPGSLRRELVGPQGMLEETVLAVEAPAAVVVQWRRRGITHDPLDLTLAFGIPCGEGTVRYRAGEDAVVVQAEGGSPLLVTLSPPPESWRVGEADGGELRVEAEVSSPDAVTLALHAGPRPVAVTRVLENLSAHHTRLQKMPAGNVVRTVTGVADLDDGLAWLVWRLAHAPGSGEVPPVHLLWWGLGALAVGSRQAALRALSLLEERDAPEDAALLAARVALVTGEQDAARRYVDFRPGSAWGRTAAGALADALRYAATDDAIDGLRTAGAGTGVLPGTLPGNSISLPMAGEPAGSPLPAWLSATVAETRHRPDSGADLVAAAQEVAALAAGDADAYGSWRRRLEEGLDGGPGGRGTWDPFGGGCPAVAGALACGLLHGILGWQPDAPVGRLGLAPLLPGHLRAFAATGLAVGDVGLDLAYERTGREHRYTLTPTSGRVPATLVFEPAVVAQGVEEVTLDGGAVELDVRQARDRRAISVQIPLDGPRVLLLKAEGEEPGGYSFSSM